MSIRPWQLKELEDIQNVLIEEYRLPHRFIWGFTLKYMTKLETLHALQKYKDNIDHGPPIELDDANTWMAFHTLVKVFDNESFDSRKWTFKNTLFEIVRYGRGEYGQHDHLFGQPELNHPDGRKLKLFGWLATRMYPASWQGVQRDENGAKVSDAVKSKSLQDFEVRGITKWHYSFILSIQKATDALHEQGPKLSYEFRIPDLNATIDGVTQSITPDWPWVLEAMRACVNRFRPLNPHVEWLPSITSKVQLGPTGKDQWRDGKRLAVLKEANRYDETSSLKTPPTAGPAVGLGIQAPSVPEVIEAPISAPRVPKVGKAGNPDAILLCALMAENAPKVTTTANANPASHKTSAPIIPNVAMTANSGPAVDTISAPILPKFIGTPANASCSALFDPISAPILPTAISTPEKTSTVVNTISAPSIPKVRLPDTRPVVNTISAPKVPKVGKPDARPVVNAVSALILPQSASNAPLSTILAPSIPQSGMRATIKTPSRLPVTQHPMSAPARANMHQTPPQMYIDPRRLMSAPAVPSLQQRYMSSPSPTPRPRMANGTHFTAASRQTLPTGVSSPGLLQQRMPLNGSSAPQQRMSEQEQVNLIQSQENMLLRRNGQYSTYANGQVQSTRSSPPQQQQSQSSRPVQQRRPSVVQLAQQSPHVQQQPSTPRQHAGSLFANQQRNAIPQQCPIPAQQQESPIATYLARQQEGSPLANSQRQAVSQQRPTPPQQQSSPLGQQQGFHEQQASPLANKQHPAQQGSPLGQQQISPNQQQGSFVAYQQGPGRFHHRGPRPTQQPQLYPGNPGLYSGLMVVSQQPPFSPGNGYAQQTVLAPFTPSPDPIVGNAGDMYQSLYPQIMGGDTGLGEFDMGAFGGDLGLEGFDMEAFGGIDMGIGVGMSSMPMEMNMMGGQPDGGMQIPMPMPMGTPDGDMRGGILGYMPNGGMPMSMPMQNGMSMGIPMQNGMQNGMGMAQPNGMQQNGIRKRGREEDEEVDEEEPEMQRRRVS